MGVNIDVRAERQADGSVRCRVKCDGQEAAVIFTGSEVFFEAPEPQEST